jgi:hypothetical protein
MTQCIQIIAQYDLRISINWLQLVVEHQGIDSNSELSPLQGENNEQLCYLH